MALIVISHIIQRLWKIIILGISRTTIIERAVYIILLCHISAGVRGVQSYSVRSISSTFPVINPKLHIRLYNGGPQPHWALHPRTQPTVSDEQEPKSIRFAHRTGPESSERRRTEMCTSSKGATGLEFDLHGLLQRTRLPVSKTIQ